MASLYVRMGSVSIESLAAPSRLTFAVVESLPTGGAVQIQRQSPDLALPAYLIDGICKSVFAVQKIVSPRKGAVGKITLSREKKGPRMTQMKSANLQSVGFCGLMLAACLGVAPFGLAQADNQVVVVKATMHAFAPPLSQMKPVPPGTGANADAGNDDDRMAVGPQHSGMVTGADTVVQTSNADIPTSEFSGLSAIEDATQSKISANSGINILGIGNGFSGYTEQASVPDTNGAAGGTQFVQFVNDSFAVFNKTSGALLYGPASGNTLWRSLGGPCAAATNLDESAQFDKLAGVWVMLMPVFSSPNYICVAVSNSADATNGSWNLYAFEEPVSAVCGCRMQPDYPKLGIWPSGYFITYNQGWNNNFEGSAVCALNRNAMLSGNAATMQCVTTSPANGSLLPGDFDGTIAPPTGAPEYLMSFNGNDQSLNLWQYSVNFQNPSQSSLTGPTNIPVAAFTEACGETAVEITYTTGDCIPQKGTSQNLDSYGDRIMYRLAYRNFGSYAALVANHAVTIGSGSSQTGIRWYELENSGGGFSLYQQGTYAPDSNYRWMGSIAMDKAGDIAMGYSVSSSSMSPSIRYTGRLSTDTLGTMEGETDVLSQAGVSAGSQTNSFHWADYSSLAIDPTDDCTFWYTTEYQPLNGNNRWATRIASFSFPACTSSYNYTLSVSQVGNGTITSADGEINCTNGNGHCSAVYAGGTAVALTAAGASGWSFSGWSGPCSGGNPCNLTVNANETATATFSSNWSLVHKTSAEGSPLTSLTIPSTGAGNAIIVGLVFNGTTKVSSVSDNVGNTYFSAGAHATKGNLSTEIWYSENSKAGATALTVTFAGALTHAEMTAWEVAGLASGVPDAKNTSSGLVTANNTAGAAVTTSQSGDFVVAILFASSSKFSAMTTGNSFTDDFTTNGNGWAHLTSNTASAGTYQPSWYSALTGGGYATSTAAFLAANP
jgi:Divergent InlB B-repeat domain